MLAGRVCLALCIARKRYVIAIVARHAVINVSCEGVIPLGGLPTRHYMASDAIIAAGCHMLWENATRGAAAVVAGDAAKWSVNGSSHDRVIVIKF